jgi:hypothetical protein
MGSSVVVDGKLVFTPAAIRFITWLGPCSLHESSSNGSSNRYAKSVAHTML